MNPGKAAAGSFCLFVPVAEAFRAVASTRLRSGTSRNNKKEVFRTPGDPRYAQMPLCPLW